MTSATQSLNSALEERGVSRRDFMRFCAGVAAMLALPREAGGQIARALERAPKPVLIWLEFQDCAGNTESFLRAQQPDIAEIVLDTIAVNYHETIMAAAGRRAEEVRNQTIAKHKGKYLVVVEGSIPLADGGVYCTIGGRTAIDIAREVCGQAAATIALGTCATHGGIPAAAPNPTGAVGVAEALPDLKTLINLTACPANVENLTALLVYYLTFGRWPELDAHRRPLFSNRKLIHDACERRTHFNAGQFVEAWGDAGHRTGYCLYKMGCKGPVTFYNCPAIRWNEKTSWPIGSGHGCIGCAEPHFWDRMTPFYAHLPDVPGVGRNIDKVGVIAAAAVAAGFAAHGVASFVKRRTGAWREEERKEEEGRKGEDK
jgi:hydrogenase small subunit